MLDLLSSRKSTWLALEEKLGLGGEKAKLRRHSEKRKPPLLDSRPHSYHGGANQSANLKNAIDVSRKLEKCNSGGSGRNSAGRQLKNKLLASLNCTQTDVYSTLQRMRNEDHAMVEFGYGGGFADVSQTWKFHPFKTR